MISGLFTGLVAGAVGYLGMCLYLYIQQDYMIFYPVKVTDQTLKAVKNRFPKSLVYITTKDGVKLQGFELNRKEGLPLVLYFGGNAEEMSEILPILSHLEGFHTVLMNYRGYGQSQGHPGQKAFYSDAIEIYDWFSKRFNVGANNIFLIGRSLGSAVSLWLASNRSVRAICLITPIDSVENLAKSLYPYIPVSLLLKHKFDAQRYARSIEVPVLVLLAENDETVPSEHSERLIKALQGPVTVRILKGVDHGTIMDHPKLTEFIQDFFEEFRN